MSVKKIDRPELIFGLVGPVGVDLDMITGVLSAELERQKYSSHLIHVTNIMRDVSSNIKIVSEPYLESIKSRIRYADDVCLRLERHDALAAITISAIQSSRERLNRERAEGEGSLGRLSEKDLQAPTEARAFIVRQFKRPAEINLMRQVYGKLFFQISAYSSPDDRETYFTQKLKDLSTGPSKIARRNVKQLSSLL